MSVRVIGPSRIDSPRPFGNVTDKATVRVDVPPTQLPPFSLLLPTVNLYLNPIALLTGTTSGR